MTPIASLAKKFRSALRNDRGARFSAEELRQLAEAGMLDLVQAAEAQELKSQWREKTGPASAAHKGPILDRGAIAALGRDTSGGRESEIAALTHEAQSELTRAAADRVIEAAKQARRSWRNK